MPLSRPALYAGIAGPAAFIGAWATGSFLKDGYSPVRDTISRLAEPGSSTRVLMTAGFVGFGVFMTAYAREVGRALDSPGAAAAVGTTALATLAVAAFPVTAGGGTTSDTVHYLAAGTAYVANAIAPLVAARHLRNGPARAGSAAAGVAVAAALIGSIVAPDEVTGLLQRTGLTLYDAWSVALAVGLLRQSRTA